MSNITIKRNQPLISVIMPIYNSGEYLDTAVDSILNQTFRELELILVDDGSTDGSSEKCDEYAKKDNRVVVIHQKNGGICNARNAALKIARGEYIGFSDHDDEYKPTLLEQAYNATQNGTIDIVKFFKENPCLKGNSIIRMQPQHIEGYIYLGDDIRQNIIKLINSGTLVCVWDGIYKHSLIKTNDIEFDSTIKSGGEDIDFMLKLIKHASSIIAIEQVLYTHYFRIGFSTSSKFDPNKIETLKKNLESVYKLLLFWNIDFENNDDYLFFVAKEYLCPLLSFLSKNKKSISKYDKDKLLDEIIIAKGVPYRFKSANSLKVLKKEIKIGLAYFLYKHSLYWLLLKMFSLRYKIIS